MKPYNEKEFNRLCAEFLGYEISENKECFKSQNQKGWNLLNIFHSHWNWIMEVVEKIENTKKNNEWYVEYIWLPSTNISFSVRGWRDGSVLFETFGRFYGVTTKKEAVVQAIWQFLNWYNEQKQ
jgi:hypothetical protein